MTFMFRWTRDETMSLISRAPHSLNQISSHPSWIPSMPCHYHSCLPRSDSLRWIVTTPVLAIVCLSSGSDTTSAPPPRYSGTFLITSLKNERFEITRIDTLLGKARKRSRVGKDKMLHDCTHQEDGIDVPIIIPMSDHPAVLSHAVSLAEWLHASLYTTAYQGGCNHQQFELN